MPIEHEAKILDIDPLSAEAAIRYAGGYMVQAERTMRRYVYDVTRGDQSKWIRLREEDRGSCCFATLTVKEITHDGGIDGTIEHEMQVNSFDTTHTMLRAMGFTAKSYQENRRTSFVLHGARVEIDTWPMIPPYMEIEADSTEDVIAAAGVLGYDESDLFTAGSFELYRRHGIDLAAITELKF